MFRRGSHDRVSVSIRAEEADIIRRLITEYVELLGNPDPPVRTRLYPAASLDDPEVEASFRDLSENDLARHKRATAAVALESLGEAGPWKRALDPDQQEAWLMLLTDLRLVIGTRQGVTEEMMERIPDPRAPDEWPLAVLHYLGALQESLVAAVT